MKNYYGRQVQIYENNGYKTTDTGETGCLLEIDIHNEHVMIEDRDGNLIKLFYKLVRLI